MKDQYGRTVDYLRLSVTDLCNYRCRYCMPPEGVEKLPHSSILSLEEYVEIAAAAVGLGITKIRVTGGEPLVRRGIVELCRALRAIPGLRELCLTTNGSQLTALAAPLRDAGVDRLNISLDTLHPEHFRAMTRTGSLEDVLSGIQAAERAGFKQLKLDTVLIGGFNENEIRPLAELTLTHPWEVRFIELMPMGTCAGWDKACFLPADRIGASAGAKGTAAGGRSAAVPSAGGCWNGGVDRPPEPRILRGLPPNPRHGGREAEGLSPQPGGNFPPGAPRPVAKRRPSPGHFSKAKGALPDGGSQRDAPHYERDRRLKHGRADPFQ